jgi:hypothetical protein
MRHGKSMIAQPNEDTSGRHQPSETFHERFDQAQEDAGAILLLDDTEGFEHNHGTQLLQQMIQRWRRPSDRVCSQA